MKGSPVYYFLFFYVMVQFHNDKSRIYSTILFLINLFAFFSYHLVALKTPTILIKKTLKYGAISIFFISLHQTIMVFFFSLRGTCFIILKKKNIIGIRIKTKRKTKPSLFSLYYFRVFFLFPDYIFFFVPADNLKNDNKKINIGGC